MVWLNKKEYFFRELRIFTLVVFVFSVVKIPICVKKHLREFDKKFKFQGGNYPYLYIIQELNTVNRRKEGKIKTVLSRAVFSAKIHSNASVFTARHFVLQMDNSKHPNGCNSTVVNPLLCEIFAESQHFSCILILVFQMNCSAKLSHKWWKLYPFQKYLYRTVMSHSCLPACWINKNF